MTSEPLLNAKTVSVHIETRLKLKSYEGRPEERQVNHSWKAQAAPWMAPVVIRAPQLQLFMMVSPRKAWDVAYQRRCRA